MRNTRFYKSVRQTTTWGDYYVFEGYTNDNSHDSVTVYIPEDARRSVTVNWASMGDRDPAHAIAYAALIARAARFAARAEHDHRSYYVDRAKALAARIHKRAARQERENRCGITVEQEDGRRAPCLLPKGHDIGEDALDHRSEHDMV